MREDWIECRLDQVSEINPKLENKSEIDGELEIQFLPMRLVEAENNITHNIETRKFKEVQKKSYTYFEEADILFAKVTPCMENGKIAIASNLKNNVGYGSSEFHVFRASKLIFKELLFYFLVQKDFRRNAQHAMTGAVGLRRVPKKYLENHSIPLPPLVEQKAIVKKIEELFSSLDSGIADLKKAQDQLVIYRQAVLKKAFEGELTKEWRDKQTNLPSADELLEQIKEERQKHYEKQLADWKDAVKLWKNEGANDKKPAKPKFIKELTNLTEEELDKLPMLNKYWHWVKADKIASHEASSLKAGPFGSSLKKEFYTESGYKIYGQEQVIANNHKIGNYYVNQEKYDSLINCAVKPYDILISLVGTVGKVLVLPKGCKDGIINPRLVKISLNKFYDSIFFKYYFESAFLKSIYAIKAHGATMDILNLGIIKELPYPLCSKQEQHQIVQEIESRLSVCDKVEKDIADSLKKAQALRQSILKKAFEGKLLSEEEIAACKAHPEYEPASVLLGRIKAEKAANQKKKK